MIGPTKGIMRYTSILNGFSIIHLSILNLND